MSKASFFFFLFFLSAIFARHCQAKISGKSITHNGNFSSSSPAALFVFGDSFLDAGNNNYIKTTTLDQANFWPYGETYFNFPTGRFSDGRLISDFIAQYAKLPFIPPFLQPRNRLRCEGVNFASAGAGALDETFKGKVVNLKTQLENYRKVEALWRRELGEEEAKQRISKAVHLFSIGSNDYMSPFLTNPTILNTSLPDKSRYVAMVVGNFTAVIKEIYKTGGRKFAVMNLPELGCLPSIRILRPDNGGRCLEEVSMLATSHNKALLNLMFELSQQLKEFKFSVFDFYSSLRLRMNHPSKYGFKEGEEACCGTGSFRGIFSCGGKRRVKEFELCEDPNQYLFWDSFHLTEKANRQFATEMWSGTGTTRNPLVHGPYNFKKLFQIL